MAAEESASLRQRKKEKKKQVEEDEEKPSAGTPGEPPQSRYKKFLTRTIMGAMMIFIFTGIINSDHIIIASFVVGLQILVFREILNVRYNVVKEKELYGFRSLNWFFLWTTMFYFYGKPILLQLDVITNSKINFFMALARYHLGISFALYVIGFVTFVLTLRSGFYKYQITQMTWTIMILVVIIAQSNFIVKNLFEGIVWFLLPCAIIVCNDIFAYFSGFFFGKKFIQKPFLTISPNKTWEGFIGATFWTLLFAFFFADFISKYQWLICPRAGSEAFRALECTSDYVFNPNNYYYSDYIPEELYNFLAGKFHWDNPYVTLRPIQLHALVLALFGSLIAPFGGFFASGIKRAYKIKDFSGIFPGHGGFTDRTDCQYIMGVFTYVYFHMFIRSSVPEFNTIWEGILELSLAEQQALLSQLNSTVTQKLLQTVTF